MVYQLLLPSLILAASTILATVIAYIYRRRKNRQLQEKPDDLESDNASSRHSGHTENTFITILPGDSTAFAALSDTSGKVIPTDITTINTTRTSTTNSVVSTAQSCSAKAGYTLLFSGSLKSKKGNNTSSNNNKNSNTNNTKTHNTNSSSKDLKYDNIKSNNNPSGYGQLGAAMRGSGNNTYRYNHFNTKQSPHNISRTTSDDINKFYNTTSTHNSSSHHEHKPGQITNISVDKHGNATIETVRAPGNGEKIPIPPPTNTYYSNSMYRTMQRQNSLVGPASNDCDTQSHLSDAACSGISNSNNSVKSLPEFIPNYDSLNIRVETNRASLKLSNFTLPPLGTGGTPTSSTGSMHRSNSTESDVSSALGVIR